MKEGVRKFLGRLAMAAVGGLIVGVASGHVFMRVEGQRVFAGRDASSWVKTRRGRLSAMLGTRRRKGSYGCASSYSTTARARTKTRFAMSSSR